MPAPKHCSQSSKETHPKQKDEDTLMIILTRFLDPGSPGCPGGPGGPGMATAKTKQKREVTKKHTVCKMPPTFSWSPRGAFTTPLTVLQSVAPRSRILGALCPAYDSATLTGLGEN